MLTWTQEYAKCQFTENTGKWKQVKQCQKEAINQMQNVNMQRKETCGKEGTVTKKYLQICCEMDKARYRTVCMLQNPLC